MSAGPCPWGGSPPLTLTRKDMKTEEKVYLANKHILEKQSLGDVAKAHHLPKKVIQFFVDNVKKNPLNPFSGGKGGRLGLLDEQSKQALKEIHGGDKRIQLSEEESEIAINHEIVQTAQRRGRAVTSTSSVSTMSRKNIEKDLGIETEPAEETTSAREKECRSVRNSVTFIASILATRRRFRRGMLLNFDAKSSELGDKKVKRAMAKFIRNEAGNGVKGGKSIKVRKGRSKGITAYFIRTILTISDGGQVGTLVHVIASAGLPKGEIMSYVVEGLGLSGLMKGDPAIIVFCQTRTSLPVEAFHNNIMWDRVVLPLADRIRTQLQLPKETPAMTNCDGGDDQIDLFKLPTFQAKLAENHMEATNPPGSTTEITQPADQRVFRTINNVLRGKDSHKDVPGPHTEEFKTVAEAFAKHQNDLQRKQYPVLSSSHVRMGIEGTLRLTTAIQRSINPVSVKGSFQDTGQDITMSEEDIITKVLQQCTTVLSPDQESSIRAAFVTTANKPSLTDLYVAGGRLTEKEMDEHNIPDDENPTGKKKDERIIAQQRTVHLTHEKIIALLYEQKTNQDAAKTKKDEAAAQRAADVAAGVGKEFQPYAPRGVKRDRKKEKEKSIAKAAKAAPPIDKIPKAPKQPKRLSKKMQKEADRLAAWKAMLGDDDIEAPGDDAGEPLRIPLLLHVEQDDAPAAEKKGSKKKTSTKRKLGSSQKSDGRNRSKSSPLQEGGGLAVVGDENGPPVPPPARSGSNRNHRKPPKFDT